MQHRKSKSQIISCNLTRPTRSPGRLPEEVPSGGQSFGRLLPSATPQQAEESLAP